LLRLASALAAQNPPVARGSQSLADEFRGMPHGGAWTRPQPYLVCAAVELSAGRYESSTAALDAAEGILEGLPADQQAASRLAAAAIRLTASLRNGDLAAAAMAADGAEVLVSRGTTAQVMPVIVEQLSKREREVLGYMSAMLTTAEVASELYISTNTVKAHLKSIYRKLGAAHCREAVRRGRQLGLV
jgi:LuxR family transcriptional regulator, maltose regulon positive regulatory protein